MLVFHKAKLVVLAVPKTGTTALETALAPLADATILNPPQNKHCTWRRYRRQLAPFFEGKGPRFETLAVMREPLDWLSSWHRYRARDAILGSPASTRDVDFMAFVEAWLGDAPPEFARVGRQSRFVSRGDGRLGVDHLFRHDRMAEVVAFLEARLGRSVDLPRRNVSGGAAETLPEAMAARLRAEAPEEFTLWQALCEGRLDALR